MIDPTSLDPVTLPHLAGGSGKGYPGRDRLDRSHSRLRKALARLAREGLRDPETAAKLEPIVTAAAKQMDALAAEAEKAADGSARNKALIAKAEERLNRTLRRGARDGSPAAARMLAKFNAPPATPKAGA